MLLKISIFNLIFFIELPLKPTKRQLKISLSNWIRTVLLHSKKQSNTTMKRTISSWLIATLLESVQNEIGRASCGKECRSRRSRYGERKKSRKGLAMTIGPLPARGQSRVNTVQGGSGTP